MHRQIKWLRITQLVEDRKSHKIYHSFCSSVPTITLTDQYTCHLKMKYHLLNNTAGTKRVCMPWLYFDLHLPHLILGIHWYTLSRYFGHRGVRRISELNSDTRWISFLRVPPITFFPSLQEKPRPAAVVTEGAVQTCVFCSIRCQKWTQTRYAKRQKKLHLYLYVKLWPEFLVHQFQNLNKT